MHHAAPRNGSIGVKAEAFAFPEGSRHHDIQVAAYFFAKERGFAAGHELEDWLKAERQVCQHIDSRN
jgi:hypothetical protein